MADFRRWLPAFAVLAVSMMALAPASAQVGLNCVGTGAVPPLLRAEGFTELTGDVVISCTSTSPLSAATSPLPTANLTLFLTVPITSRLVSSAVGNSEILLMIDEPSSSVANPCATAPSAGAPGCPETPASVGSLGTGATNFHNIYQGTILTNAAGQGYAVQFLGVPIVPPATVGGTPTTYRITNIRGDVVGIGGVLGSPAQVQATLSISPVTPGATMTLANPTQVVGFVQPGLTFSVSKVGSNATPFNIQQCNGVSALAGGHATLNFAENFATAFRVRINGQAPAVDGTLANPVTAGGGGPTNVIPGSYFNNESGYYNPTVNTALGVGTNTIGLADTGTRLKAVFSNIPSGVSIYVGLTNNGATANGTLAYLTSAEVGPYSAVTGTSGAPAGMTQIPLTNGAGTAVWEVLASQGSVNETFSFPVTFSATGAAGATPPSPAVGEGFVAGSLAPNPSSGVFTATQAALPSSTLPIPRFADTGTPIGLVTVNTCRTILLYPFVTNQLGFDTGMAISNTSTDPYSSVGTQAGTCTLSFFGASAPSALTTASIGGGTTYTTLASSVAPGFQGYVFAICNFQFAHGFAFVSDMGARNLAMGYLPLIVPDRGGKIRLPDPFSTAGAATGEILGQ